MNPQDQRTIEQLLEQLAAEEQLGSSSHRYALRRSLCNSKYFEVHRARIVWERIVAISAPAFAGGFVVVLAVLAVNVGISPADGTNGFDAAQFVQTEELPLVVVEEEGEDVFKRVLPNAEMFSFPRVDTVGYVANVIKQQPAEVFTR